MECSCGKKKNNSNHDHSLKTVSDETSHWKECENCDYVSDKEAHKGTYKENVDKHYLFCNVCREEYGFEAHNYNIMNYSSTYHWKECVCGKKDTTENHNTITKYDNDNHWYECKECEYVSEKQAHSMHESSEVKGDIIYTMNGCDKCYLNTVTTSTYVAPKAEFNVSENSDGTLSLEFKENTNIVDIPAEIDGKKVTKFYRYGTNTIDIIINSDLKVISGSRIRKVTVKNTCEEISTRLDLDCDELYVEEGVKTICANAFHPRKKVTIPSTITYYGSCKDSIYYIHEKFDIYYNGDLADYLKLEYGFVDTVMSKLYFKNDNGYYECPKDLVIPEGTTSIPNCAFYYYSLNSVTLNEGLKKIGNSAFYATGVSKISIPDSVEEIGRSAFKNIYTNIPSSLKKVGEYGLYHSKRKTLVIPASVEIIGRAAFGDYFVEIINLSSVTTYHYQEVLQYKTSGESTVVYDGDFGYMMKDGIEYLVAYIGDSNSVTLPAKHNGNELYLSKYMLAGVKLDKLEIPGDYTSIPERFAYNATIKELVLHEGLEVIRKEAFYGDDFIENVELPSSLTTIFDYGCYTFKYNVLTMPEKLVDIGQYAFGGAKTVYITNKTNASVYQSYCFPELENIYYPGSSENFFKRIGLARLSSSSKYNIFALNDEGVTEQVTSVNITSNSIPNFTNLKSIYSVTINAYVSNFYISSENTSVVEIINLGSVTVSDSTKNQVLRYATSGASSLEIVDKFVFLGTDEANYLVGYLGDYRDTKVVLPETYKGTSYIVRNYAFINNKFITEVVIPSTITEIEYNAFTGCKITELTTPVLTVNNYSIVGTGNLKTLTINSNATEILEADIKKYSNITKLVLPSTLTTISNNNFSSNYYLEELIIPEGVTTIGEQVTYYAKRIVIPSTVTTIASNAFSSDNNLYEIVNLSSVEISNFNETLRTTEGTNLITTEDGFVYYVKEDSNYNRLVDYVGDKKIITLPQTLGEKKYSIRSHALDSVDTIIVDTDGLSYDWYWAGSASDNKVLIASGGRYYNSHSYIVETADINTEYFANFSMNGIEFYDMDCNLITLLKIEDGVQPLVDFARTSIKNLVITNTYNEITIRSKIDMIYFEGTKEQWDAIYKNTLACYTTDISFYSETQPTEAGNYWHYVNDVVTLW